MKDTQHLDDHLLLTDDIILVSTDCDHMEAIATNIADWFPVTC